MSDVIEIRGLRVTATIGVLPEEKERAQPFEIDIDLHTDLSEAGRTDDLDATVHYGEVAAAVVDRVTSEHHELLERVAQRIVDTVFEFDRVEAVTVTIAKLRPPVPLDVVSTGVRVHRRRG